MTWTAEHSSKCNVNSTQPYLEVAKSEMDHASAMRNPLMLFLIEREWIDLWSWRFGWPQSAVMFPTLCSVLWNDIYLASNVSPSYSYSGTSHGLFQHIHLVWCPFICQPKHDDINKCLALLGFPQLCLKMENWNRLQKFSLYSWMSDKPSKSFLLRNNCWLSSCFIRAHLVVTLTMGLWT